MVTAQQIKEVRDRLGETQADFGERFGVNQTTVHRWEHRTPKRKSVQKSLERTLARYLRKAK